MLLLVLSIVEGRLDECIEQGVGFHGLGLELGMELAADEIGVIRHLDHLDEGAVRAEPGEDQSVLLESQDHLVYRGRGNFEVLPHVRLCRRNPVDLGIVVYECQVLPLLR